MTPDYLGSLEDFAAAILARWVKAGLVMEQVQPGDALPATEELGHAAACSFGWVICTFPACGRRVTAHGLCQAHYCQRRSGQPLKPLRKRGEGKRKRSA